MSFSWSGGKFTEGSDPYAPKLYPLTPDDRRQVVRILRDVRKIVLPENRYEFDKAIKVYQNDFARDPQEKRLCDYLWNLIRSRCYPYMGYDFWLGQFGIDLSEISKNPDKLQDAQLRWIDSLIEEFSAAE